MVGAFLALILRKALRIAYARASDCQSIFPDAGSSKTDSGNRNSLSAAEVPHWLLTSRTCTAFSNIVNVYFIRQHLVLLAVCRFAVLFAKMILIFSQDKHIYYPRSAHKEHCLLRMVIEFRFSICHVGQAGGNQELPLEMWYVRGHSEAWSSQFHITYRFKKRYLLLQASDNSNSCREFAYSYFILSILIYARAHTHLRYVALRVLQVADIPTFVPRDYVGDSNPVSRGSVGTRHGSLSVFSRESVGIFHVSMLVLVTPVFL